MAETLKQKLPKLNRYTVVTSLTVYHVQATDPEKAVELVGTAAPVVVALEGFAKIVWPTPSQIDEVNKP